MKILLLTKIAKLAWFDTAEIKAGLVTELTKILSSQNQAHRLIGL